MMDRIMGVLMLKAPTYREIADDQSATSQAGIIVVIATLIAGFFQGLISANPQTGAITPSIGGAIVGAIITVIVGLIGWYISSWVLAFVAGRMGGKTNTNEMLRVTGFVQSFSLVSILNVLVLITPLLGCLTGLMSFVIAILQLIGYVIGVREAGEFTTGNAVVTAIIAAIVNFLIVAVIGGALIGVIAAVVGIAR